MIAAGDSLTGRCSVFKTWL